VLSPRYLRARLGAILYKVMRFPHPKRLSCGVVIVNSAREVLLCHVTGQNHWDLPKGGIDVGETPLEAALRETREECGLRLTPEELADLGRFEYTTKKNLHLFGVHMPRFDLAALRCESHYIDRYTQRPMPEMDGFGWFAFERVEGLCTQKMAAVLTEKVDLRGLLVQLAEPGLQPPVAA
jgi:putative (di)nucleoside polyphosphate hydrolase